MGEEILAAEAARNDYAIAWSARGNPAQLALLEMVAPAALRACRLDGAISRLSDTYQQGLLTPQRKRTGGNQHVTVKHIHQQVNVTEGGQAVVAGDTVTRGHGERRRGMIEK